ncbi:MAG: hypothetical protein ACLFMT_01510 [Halobacteriales archaeon]
MDLLVTATETEARAFVEAEAEASDLLGRPLYSGDPAVLVSGVGRTNAAATTAVALESLDVDRVVATGVCGALPGSGLEVGDLVVGTEAVHADLGRMEPDGYVDLVGMGFEAVEGSGVTFELDDLSVDASRQRVATVSAASASDEIAEEVAERTEAGVESMETAAVAQTAYLQGTPASALLAVSNYAATEREFDLPHAVESLSRGFEEVYG